MTTNGTGQLWDVGKQSSYFLFVKISSPTTDALIYRIWKYFSVSMLSSLGCVYILNSTWMTLQDNICSLLQWTTSNWVSVGWSCFSFLEIVSFTITHQLLIFKYCDLRNFNSLYEVSYQKNNSYSIFWFCAGFLYLRSELVLVMFWSLQGSCSLLWEQLVFWSCLCLYF